MNKLPLFSKGKTGKISFHSEKQPNIFFWLNSLIFFVVVFFVILLLRLFQLTVVRSNYYQQLAKKNRLRELYIEAPRGKIVDCNGQIIAESFPADISQNKERLTSTRIYHEPEAVAPVVGYIQTADENEIENDACLEKLTLGDKIGKKGVEKIYDCILRGHSGTKAIEVDAKGKYLKTLTVVPEIPGETVQLALDLDLQKKAYELLKGKKGAVVAIKPTTGEVLALVSTPSYNPKEIEKYLKDKDNPLFNRATEGTYPPGSIFKIVVAAGALETGAIDEKTQVEDTGQIQAGPITFGNWYYLQYGKTEGQVNLVKAIQRSNDIFFYKTGEKMGEDKIKLWAEKFGYGKIYDSFGLEQSTGLIPSSFWKKETFGETWYLGDTYNLSIGQGYILVTPLQTALVTTTIANNGYLCTPQLTKAQNSKLKTQSCQKVPISEKTLKLIQEGMIKACTTGGTGWPFFDFMIGTNSAELTTGNKSPITKIQVACKTGTAELHTQSKISHAWFTVYAPAVNPEIALTVLIEEGGQGSDIAGPVAKEILKTYFEKN